MKSSLGAETKARAAAVARAEVDQIILAADTAVVDGTDILGKPKDHAEAIAMLRRLRGRTHQVYSGIALLPAWATSRYPEKGAGYLDFDVQKAKEYTKKKADYIADVFLEAVQRWEMMEKWIK